MRGKVLLVAVWVAGVLAASFVTWRAIDAAGKQILSEPFRTVMSSELSSASAQPSSESPSPSVSSTTATRSPGKGKDGSGGKGGTSSAPSGPTTAPAPQGVTRAWRGDAGYIVATCTGPSLDSSATPNDGYGIEVEHQGQSTDKVHFEPKGDRGSEVNVLVTCTGGIPQFSTQSED